MWNYVAVHDIVMQMGAPLASIALAWMPMGVRSRPLPNAPLYWATPARFVLDEIARLN